jgi:hypothetical protein
MRVRRVSSPQYHKSEQSIMGSMCIEDQLFMGDFTHLMFCRTFFFSFKYVFDNLSQFCHDIKMIKLFI